MTEKSGETRKNFKPKKDKGREKILRRMLNKFRTLELTINQGDKCTGLRCDKCPLRQEEFPCLYNRAATNIESIVKILEIELMGELK